ncbi:MAG: hypothetical protein Q8914_09450 [Bacteroidota bacterium]|nr:hypothetical protein [Bacteroidota bacterium]
MKLKTMIVIALTGLLPVLVSSCGDDWDQHYQNDQSAITNNDVLIVDETTEQYLQSQDSLSDMYQFLKGNGIFETMDKKAQLHTLFAVNNGEFVDVDAKEAAYVAKSHVTDISISPSNLYDGERILMWHGKYVSVSLDSAARKGAIDHIQFNNIAVRQVVKTTDGYIYVLKKMINTPQSLYDIINGLDDNYSIFRNLVMSKNVSTFDKANSKPIGVDKTGNTIYDSTFIISNPFFDTKNFSLTSESLTATVLIPSNNVINQAMSDARKKLAAWDMTRDSSILKNWILEVAFFNKTYTPSDLTSTTDLYSIYDRQWRTTVQQLDLDNPISMSNGVAYKVKWMKIPNNVLMYRLKDYFYYYESCSEEQKANYFIGSNLVFSECVTDVAAWTPLAGVWPSISNRILSYTFADASNDGFMLDFTPIKRVLNSDGSYEIRPWKIPPGEYRLCMGFKQNVGLDVTISVNGVDYGKVTLGSATTFHYDRGGVGYPEGYQEAMDAGTVTHSKKAMYDRDGGQISSAVTLTGDGNGNPAPISIRIRNTSLNGVTKMVFHHWCLRPTINNY